MLEVTGRAPSEAAVAELCAKKQPAFDALAKTQKDLALPGSVDLLDAAKAAGWKVAIASGATRADITLMLELLDRSDAFDAIVTADDVARSKPDPASYAQAAYAIGIAPRLCLAIEDTRAGLRSATAAGLRTLAVTTSHDAAELEGEAQRVVETLRGVTPERLQHWYAEGA
jgi:beta-phosphoglucomutase